MNFSPVIVLWLGCVLWTGTQQNPAATAGAAKLQAIIVGSKRLQGVFTEATSGTQFRIGFEEIPSGEGLFQGFTTFRGGLDGNGVTVHVASGLSQQLTELLLAHELFHVILVKRGFPIDVNVPKKNELAGTFAGAVLADAITALGSCYADSLIDKLMSARGFDPKIINRREEQITIQQVSEAKPVPLQVFALWRQNLALTTYCLSIRERDFEMKDIFKAWQGLDPTMGDDVAQIQREMGTELCKDATRCIEATKKLRRITGFEGEVQFLNPATGSYE